MQTSELAALKDQLENLLRLMPSSNNYLDTRFDRSQHSVQTALTDYQSDPTSASKRQRLTRAIEQHQISVELMLEKCKEIIEQAHDLGIDIPIADDYAAQLAHQLKLHTHSTTSPRC